MGGLVGCGMKLGGIQKSRRNESSSPAATLTYVETCGLGVCEPLPHTG